MNPDRQHEYFNQFYLHKLNKNTKARSTTDRLDRYIKANNNAF